MQCFDLSEYRIHGCHPDEVNEGRLNETLEVARSYLGQELIVIFQTAAFNNNVVTSEDSDKFPRHERL
jgi:hypothetical protein